jgi:hypothetical protein
MVLLGQEFVGSSGFISDDRSRQAWGRRSKRRDSVAVTDPGHRALQPRDLCTCVSMPEGATGNNSSQGSPDGLLLIVDEKW